MSTIVYQGSLHQSCFEPQVIETTTLKLKVPTPYSVEFGREQVTTGNLDLGGWSFLQTLSSSTTYKDSHSYSYSYSTSLSEKSLQLCTESLGSETGTDIMMESSIFSSSFSKHKQQLSSGDDNNNISDISHEWGMQKLRYSQTLPLPCEQQQSSDINNSNNPNISRGWSMCKVRCAQTLPLTCEQQQSRNNVNESISDEWGMLQKVTCTQTFPPSCEQRKSSCRKFPPPLTTMNSLQLRPHREAGRLIIKAVETPLRHNYFQAERSDGRLRLCFFKHGNDSNQKFESNIKGEDEVEKEGEEEEEEKDMWDTDGNSLDEIGIEKCQRLSRCKQGISNTGFCDWSKPFLVATS